MVPSYGGRTESVSQPNCVMEPTGTAGENGDGCCVVARGSCDALSRSADVDCRRVRALRRPNRARVLSRSAHHGRWAAYRGPRM